MTIQVFISYARRDKEFVRRLHQALPRDDRPVSGGKWPNQDAAFAVIAKELRGIIEKMRGKG